jgi:hypothetical protein
MSLLGLYIPPTRHVTFYHSSLHNYIWKWQLVNKSNHQSSSIYYILNRELVNKSTQVGLALQQNPPNAQSTWLTTEFPNSLIKYWQCNSYGTIGWQSIQNDKPGIRISFNLPGSFGLGTFDQLFAGLFQPMIVKHSVVLNRCTHKINIELSWGQIIVGNACTAAEILIS